jgi:hypothetical protein
LFKNGRNSAHGNAGKPRVARPGKTIYGPFDEMIVNHGQDSVAMSNLISYMLKAPENLETTACCHHHPPCSFAVTSNN